MTKKQTFQLLHISDLHIKADENFDRSLVLDPLIKRLEQDKRKGFRPEIVAVTGDIAYKGIREEYDLAKVFFDALLETLGLDIGNLFIIPGNHDVNRKKYRPKDIPVYDNMAELNTELENEDYRADLFKGLGDYFGFAAAYCPHLKSENGQVVPFVHTFNARCKKVIGFVGLNSAWMCRKSPDEREIAIGEYQVKKAFEELEKSGDCDLQICMFHHPLLWLWPEDKDRCRCCFNDTILLTGHLHDAAGGFYHDLNGCLFQFQAGGAYLGSESDWPARYHYITVNWDENTITLDFRKYVKKTRKWCVDSETGDDGSKTFPLNFAEDAASKQEREARLKQRMHEDRIFINYLTYALNEHRHLPMQGFETSLRVPIEIEKVYINMRAYIHAHDFEFTINGREKRHRKIKEENLSSLDIKAAFRAAAGRSIKDMIILGDPGSGKTTLLKYILVMLIDGRGNERLGIDEELIPFFAPLRDLKDPDEESFTAFIRRVCHLDQHDITEDVLKTLLDNKRGIFLLDGLDEMADEDLRLKTCKWIDDARKVFVHTRFVITSRFAGYTGNSRLEGGVMELSIQDFSPEEVAAFLLRWFETVEAALHPEDETAWKRKGTRDAQNLIKEINKSPHIQKLAKNPLLLQIIALVRRDRGTVLPQRRVELYQECVSVLLEKWDMAKGLDVLLSAREARQILQPVALWMHEKEERRSAPLAEIENIIKEPLEKIGKSDIDRNQLLLNIRDRSGIFMGYSESEYGFTHLSFQEYFAAEQIRNIQNINVLTDNYMKRWWREVILLCLGLDNPSVIEPFMRAIMTTEHFKHDITLVLDAIEDSIIKPSAPFLDALNDKKLSFDVKENVIQVLRKIGGDKVTQALKDVAKGEESDLAGRAYDTLEIMDAAGKVKKPVVKGIPEIISIAIDDSKMVRIPAGSFLYGSREDDKVADSNEKPQKTIHLDDFYIDVFPVTNRQFCEFLNKTTLDSEKLEKWIYLKGSYEKEKCRISKDRNIYNIEKGYDNYPVIYVSWYGAEAYAKWTGKRLPTEQEWEKAARGTDGRIYPWGDEFNKAMCNTRESNIGGTSVVDQFSNGKSIYGCYDMAGNVWEWTDSWYDKDKDWKTLRGGGWGVNSVNCRCAARVRFDPDDGVSFLGFRCART